MKKRWAAAGALAAGVVAAGVWFDALVVAVLTPRVAFDRSAVPPAPDYRDPAAWGALPDRVDAADGTVVGLAGGDQGAAPVDVFYVHPTSYVGRGWNAATDDATVNEATDRGATRIQASAFNRCCAVYAPRYRQANLTAFLRPTEDGARAIALGGDDVVAAFHRFLADHSRGRPFIVAAHSQGAVHALRVVREVVADPELRARMVVAYLIGGPMSEATVAAIPGLEVCDGPTQTGCVVAWNARGPGYAGGLDFVEAVPTDSPRVCVNPLTWRRDEAPVGREQSRGAVFFAGEGPPTPRPGFVSARCSGGWLVVEPVEAPPRDLMSRLLDHALGAGNYHPVEFGLFFVDLGENAQARIDAFLR